MRPTSPIATRRSSHVAMALTVVAALALSACATDDGREMKPPRNDQTDSVAVATTVAVAEPTSMTLTGPWTNGAAIDTRYTCNGLNVSPPLNWTAGPAETKSYAVVLTDLDAPDYAHWVVANIDPATLSLGEGAIPDTAIAATNSANTVGYVGPCPPTGASHTYDITVYALGQMIEAQAGDDAETMLAAIEAAQIRTASTTFTFAR